jgi:parallel beta-helix repeat protein
MKIAKILIAAALCSALITSLSLAAKVEESIFSELEKRNKVFIIVELNDNGLDTSSLESLRKTVRLNQDAVLSKLSQEEFVIKYKYNVINAFAGEVTRSGLNKLISDPLVKNIYSERILEVTLAESVPLINADDVWNLQGLSGDYTTGKGQTVCVIDTGIDYTHPDLGGCFGPGCKVLGGYDFINSDSDPMDDNAHGTHVAGIVAANGTVVGVAPDANLVAVKVCDSNGDCPGSAMIAGTDWCVNNMQNYNISILTMSIGDRNSWDSSNCPTWMDSSINTAYSFNLPITISSGNQAYKNGISYPACSPNAISVGATYDASAPGSAYWGSCTDDTIVVDKVTCFTNSHQILDLMAPGAVIYSTVLNGLHSWKSGTSMAAPHVAGTIALMKQFSNDSLTADQILTILKNTGVPVTDEGNGLTFPRIDALEAISSICLTPTDGLTITKNRTLCTGTYNLPNGLNMGASNIQLDCNGATIIGNNNNNGITIPGNSGITIKNCNIENFNYGIYINSSSNNQIIDNSIKDNVLYDIYINATTDSHCNNIFQNNIGSQNLPIEYLNVATNLEHVNLAELILCNADNSNLTNISIISSQNLNNNGILILRTDNSNLNEINSSNKETGIYLDASSNNIITSSKINNNNNGIYLYNSQGNIIQDTDLSSNIQSGIYLSNSPSTTINQNIISQTTTAINIINSDSALLTYNKISSSTDGIIILSSLNANISNNNLTSNSNAAVSVQNSVSTRILNNQIDSNGNGIIQDSSSSLSVISQNQIHSNADKGILLYSNSDLIQNNDIYSNSGGISLLGSASTLIKSNNVYLNIDNGINITNSASITIDSNNIYQNNIGIKTRYVSQCDIIDNTINSNADDGVQLTSSANNVLYGNSVTNNLNNGIDLIDSDSNEIKSNTIENNNQYGLWLHESQIVFFSDSNNITENNITSNSLGIFSSGTGNMFWKNNFLANALLPSIDLGMNVWDDGAVGNYWDTYDEPIEGCFDYDFNRVCDNPYIFGNVVDNYPYNIADGWNLGPIRPPAGGSPLVLKVPRIAASAF